MNYRLRIPLFSIMLLIAAALACSIGGGPDTVGTQVAATLSAVLTSDAATAIAAAPTPTLPPPTETASAPTVGQATEVKPSDTPAPTNTPGVQGCTDGALYVADVNIPDNTVFAPGAAFTKTWRLKNTGTCTWVGSYTFAYVSGDQMGAPTAVAIVGNVAPGSEYEVSVNFVAPSAPGTYRSRWRMHNSANAPFGSTPFVQIVVPAPATATSPASATLPPATFTVAPPTATNTPAGPTTVTIPAGANTGGVYSPPGGVFGAPNAGDDESNASRQGFVTFALSGIPAGATITAVKLDLTTPFDQLGNPFSLGCLRVYQQDFGALDAGDFFSGSPLGALWRFCSAAALSDPAVQAIDPTGISQVQAALAAGGQFQIRLQFNEMATNSNGIADLLRPTPKLIVTYTGP